MPTDSSCQEPNHSLVTHKSTASALKYVCYIHCSNSVDIQLDETEHYTVYYLETQRPEAVVTHECAITWPKGLFVDVCLTDLEQCPGFKQYCTQRVMYALCPENLGMLSTYVQ